MYTLRFVNLTKFPKFEYLKPEMENLRHKKNTCKKNIFPPKMGLENKF